MGDFFESLGEGLGGAVRWLVLTLNEAVRTVFVGLHNFFDGLARGLGLADSSIFAIGTVIAGLAFLYFAAKAFRGKRFVRGGAYSFAAILLIGWVIP